MILKIMLRLRLFWLRVLYPQLFVSYTIVFDDGETIDAAGVFDYFRQFRSFSDYKALSDVIISHHKHKGVSHIVINGWRRMER